MLPRETQLVLASQIQVIDAADQRLEILLRLQGLREGRDEGGLAGTLNAVEADEEWEGMVGCLVEGEAGEDEGDAVRGLVVDDGCAGGGLGSGHL